MPATAIYETTRRSLHAVAEHVLAAARYHATGRIGLMVTPGGFATPPFDGQVVRVERTELIVEHEGHEERRAPLTTIRAAAELVGVTPGMPPEVYRPATPLDLDAELEVGSEAAGLLAGWLALGQEALGQIAGQLRDELGEQPTECTLWPEHFDLARSSAEVTYGVSPGDDAISEPYAYVAPWARPLPGDQGFWNESFGAALVRHNVQGLDDLVAFFRAGWVAAQPG
jgi:hypothetical protein